MRPPYEPDHVERVAFADARPERGGFDGPLTAAVIALCSCQEDPIGPPVVLGRDQTAAAALAIDFNAHRDTYMEVVPA